MATDVLQLPLAEAARQSGRSVKTLLRRGAEGRLEIVKDGGRNYVTQASLLAYLGEEAEQVADWRSLPDLRALFPIPELEERRKAKKAARADDGLSTEEIN